MPLAHQDATQQPTRVRQDHRRRLSAQQVMSNICLYLFYLVVVLVFLGPVLWVVSLSLKTRAEVYAYPPRLWPRPIAWENYAQVLRSTSILRYLFNSAKITSISVAAGLFVTVPAAFAFSRFRFRGREKMLLSLLAFQMISPLIVAIPLYRYFDMLGILDSHFGVIMIYITVEIPFTVWLLKGFFDSIPRSLDEAALIDGCTRVQSVLRVILPISVPGIAAAVVFNTMSAWSQFTIPYILLTNSELFPISVGILNFQTAQTEGLVTTHILAAGAILALLPAIAIFVVLQRFIVSILIAGAVKG